MRMSVGLDIGRKNIRAVELTSDSQVTRIGAIDIPVPAGEDKFKVCADKLKQLFDEHKFSKDNVLINLRGSYVLARTYASTSLNNHGFETWFVENIDSLIPGTPLNDVIYDHQFLNSDRVLISFARLGVIEDKIKMLKSCGIIPAAIDASCLALYRAFKNHRLIQRKSNCAIIDIGWHCTDLLLVKEGVPFISTELTVGDRYLRKGRDKHNIFCQVLSTEIRKKLEYYKERENLVIDCLIVVGDYAKIPGMKKNLTNIMKMRIEIGKPFKAQKIALPSGFNRKHNSQYAQALGLALKGLDSETGMNLMPHEAREVRKSWQFNKQARSFFKKNVVISGIILLLLIYLLGITSRNFREVAHEVQELEQTRNELVYLDDEEKEMSSRLLKLKQLGHERFFWSKILSDFGKAVPKGVFFKEISTEFRLVSAGTKPVKKRKVVIEGDARSHALVIKFIKNLERHFTNITVDKIKQESRCEFTISIVL